jgi:hypothetical protein
MNSRVQRGRESEQIASILAGDVQLYHQLVRPYERSIHMVSFSYMKNEKDAEDVRRKRSSGPFKIYALSGAILSSGHGLSPLR